MHARRHSRAADTVTDCAGLVARCVARRRLPPRRRAVSATACATQLPAFMGLAPSKSAQRRRAEERLEYALAVYERKLEKSYLRWERGDPHGVSAAADKLPRPPREADLLAAEASKRSSRETAKRSPTPTMSELSDGSTDASRSTDASPRPSIPLADQAREATQRHREGERERRAEERGASNEKKKRASIGAPSEKHVSISLPER